MSGTEIIATQPEPSTESQKESVARESEYLEISHYHCDVLPCAVRELESVLLPSSTSDLELILSQQIKPGITQQMDLRYFIRIFQKLEPIFRGGVSDLPHSNTYHIENSLLVTALKFLCHILKNSNHKRYFLSIENGLIVELVSEVLFYFTMPSFSLTSISEEQVKDTASIQLSAKTIEIVSVLFDSLGYLSSSYGLLDYLRGFGPLLNPTDEIIMKYPIFPSQDDETHQQIVLNSFEEIQISIPFNNNSSESISSSPVSKSPSPSHCLANHISSIMSSVSPKLKPLQLMSLRYVIITTSSLNEPLQNRLSLVALRLRLLYILIYNQSPATTYTAVKLVENYLMVSPDSSSKFFKDLMTISDISSSIWAELNISSFPYPLASLALDCLLGIVETNQNIRRIPSRTTQSVSLLLQELGVYPSDRNNNQNANLASEFHWLSILISACGIPSLDQGIPFDNDTKENSKVAEREEIMGVMSHFPNSEGRIPKAYVAEYIHMGIELFSTCLTIREYRMHSEAVGLGTLVSFLSNRIEVTRNLLQILQRESCKDEWPELVYDLFPLWKTLQCLDAAITSHPSRNNVLREHDILNVISSLIEILSTSSSYLLWKPNSLLNDIMLSCFSLLGSIISCGRRRMIAPTESGVQLLYQAHFTTLCNSIIKNQSQLDQLFNLALLQSLCELFSAAIELEPQFLAHFLRSGIAEPLLALISSPRPIDSLGEIIQSSPLSPHPISCSYSQRGEGVLLDFLQLLRSMCLTAEGRALVKVDILKEIICAVTHPNNLTPCSEGISAESLELIGSELIRLLQEHDRAFRGVILNTLRDQFLASSSELKCQRISCPIGTNKMIDQTLQKLVNCATIIQIVFTPGRDGVSPEIVKEFFRDSLLASIFETYEFALPRSRQLFAEITTFYGGTARKYYGNYYVSQSLANLIKIAIVVSPMELLPIIFSSLDSSLAKIGEARDRLLRITHPRKSLETPNQKDQNFNSGFLGVMDSVPDECIFTTQYAECLAEYGMENYEVALQDLIHSIVALDWVISMAVICFHPQRQNRGQPIDAKLILTGKEVLRRVFAFYRSSLLEVCRIFSRQWGSKELRNLCDPSRDFEYSIFPNDCGSFVGKARFPQRYILRVSIASGAIVRERSEIDGSRVFLTVPRESELIAYERVEIQGGVIRYRTAHGWISEFQRDTKKHPIVTLLDIQDIPEPQIERDSVPMRNTSSQPLNARKPMESCTLRDGLCHLLSRSQNAMQVLAGYLSQTIVTDIDIRSSRMGSGLKFTEFGHVIAISMAKIAVKFFENPRQTENLCWPQEILPRSSSEEQLMLDKDPSRKPNWKKIHESKSFETSDEDSKFGSLSVDLDLATVSLYMGAIVNFISSSLMDDRRKNPNTYNLKRLLKHGAIHALLNSFHFIALSLESQIQKIGSSDGLQTLATPSVRCLVHSMSPYQKAIYKIVQYDALNRAPLTALMRRGPDSHDSDITIVLQKLVLKAGSSIYSLFESHRFRSFPPSIQAFWFSTIEELLDSLKVIRDINQRGGNQNGLNESLVGRIARMRNLFRPELGRSERQQESEELVSASPQQEEASNQDSYLMEAATDLGFAPLQVLDAINATHTQDMAAVLDYLLHSSNSNTSDSRTRSNEDLAYDQNSSDTNQPNESIVTIDSARSTLSHSQPETISSEQFSATQASIMSALSGLNSQLTASSSEIIGNNDSDSESDTSEEPPSFPENEGGLSHNLQGDVEAEDEDEMLRLALAMSLDSSEGTTEIQSPTQFPPNPIMPTIRETAQFSRPKKARTEEVAKSESSILVENTRRLLTDYGKMLSLFLPEFLKNLAVVKIWGENSIDLVSTRLFGFLKKIASFSANLSSSEIFEVVLKEIFSNSCQSSEDQLMLTGQLSFLHLVLSSQKSSSYPKERILQITNHLGSLLQFSMNEWSICVDMVLLIFHDLLTLHQLQVFPSGDVVESKDDVNTQSLENSDFETLCMTISHTLFPQIPQILLHPRSETIQALLLLLTSLLISESVASTFVVSGYLKNLLDLKLNVDSSSSIQPLVSLVVRRCLETSPLLTLTMKYEIKSILKKIEHSFGQQKLKTPCHIPLDEFLQKSTHLLARNSLIFTSLVKNMLTCYRFESQTDHDSQVYVKLTETTDDLLNGSIGTQALTTLNLLIEHIISSIKDKSESYFFTPSITLQAVADSALIMKAVVVPITKRSREGDSFLQFLFGVVAGQDYKSELIQSATRLLVVLACHRGSGRRIILDTFLNKLKESSIPCSIEGEETRLLILSRLGSLLPLILSACKFTREAIIPPQGQKTHHMSIDTLSYLFSSNISSLLVDAIASVDLRSSVSASVINSLMESVELFTRPSFLALFLNHNGDQSPTDIMAHADMERVENGRQQEGVDENENDPDDDEADEADDNPEEDEENDIEDDEEEEEEDEIEEGYAPQGEALRTSTRAQNRILELLEMFQGQSPDILNFPSLGNENMFQTPPDQLRSLPFDFLRPDSFADGDFTRNAFLHLIRNIAPEQSSDTVPESSREILLPGGVERALHLNWGNSVTPVRGLRSPELRRSVSERSGIFDPSDLFSSDETRVTRNLPPQLDEISAIDRELDALFQDPSRVDETQGWSVGIPIEGRSTLLDRLVTTLTAEVSTLQPPESFIPADLNLQTEQSVDIPAELEVGDLESPTELPEAPILEDFRAEPLISAGMGSIESSDATRNQTEESLIPNQDTDQNIIDPIESSQIELEIEHGELDQNLIDETETAIEAQPPGGTGLICPPGYDVEVFNSLPDFMQREIIESHQESSGDQMNDLLIAAGYDLETINALPENIRQEIIDQVRRENPQFQEPTSQPEEIDNNSFLMSLTEDLRTEVLLTAEPDFLASLNPEFQAQANVLRERHARRWAQMEATTSLRRQQERRDPQHNTQESLVVEETPKTVHPGCMRIRKDEIDSMEIPNRFWKTIFRLLYVDKLPISTSLLHKIFHNLSKEQNVRLYLVKIIMTLLGDVSRHHPLFERLKDGTTDHFPPGDMIHTTRSAVLYTDQAPSESLEAETERLFLPTLVGRRLVDILMYLCGHQESVLYEIICARPLSEIEFCTSSLWEGENQDEARQGSFLEFILSLLRRPQLTENSHDLLQLTRLIDKLCEPFEILKEINKTDSIIVTEGDEKGVKWVKVPSFSLSRDSLRSLCDALMSEYCNKEVFDHIISSISRLAEIKENCSLLVEVLVEVLSDLAGVSDSRIQAFSTHLTSSMNQDDVQSISSSQSLLSFPLGEIGSQDHMRLFRVIQTLQSLCLKMGKKIHEVTPVDELQLLWRSTDSVLKLLQRYLQEDGKELKGDQKKQQNSSLSSILSKLLPLIESFFLLHATDLLQQSLQDEQVSDEKDKESSGKKDMGTGQESLPGAKYRTTDAFKSMNISLFPSENELELQHSTSLTRMKSFPTSRSLRSNPSFDSFGYRSSTSRLFSFVRSHQAILNMLILSQPSLLEGSFQSLIRIVQLRSFLSFHSKRQFFNSMLRKKKSSSNGHHRTIHLQIHRENVFEEAFSQLRYLSGDELKGRLSVHFHEEEGVDAGGLTREFYSVLCREIFNPNYCLFTAAADGATFQPNPLSSIHNNHLDYFKFVGKIFGKALFDGYLMDGHFTRSFYKHILGLPVEYSDIEGLEPEYYKSLKQILEYSLEDLGLELTFSAETQTFGKYQVVDLIPNGRNISVTDQNKIDYIRLISHHSMTSAIRSQIVNFLDGFYSIVPVELISFFSPTELELLISGLPEIDIEDLRVNTEYHQYRINDQIIQWFWNVLRGFTREEKALFIQFVTGTSKVPLEGFANLQGMRGPQRFAIHRAYTDTANLPTAHTCFNQLDLPEYKSEEELRDKLKTAIKEGSEGFGFA